MKRACVCAVAALILSPMAAFAQERGQAGLVMGYPASVGVVFHPSDRLAIRPEIDFQFGSSEAESSIGSHGESSSRAFDAALSVLWYTAGSDNVRPYVSPRVAYGTGKTEREDGEGGSNSDFIGGSLSIGVQYAPVRRLSLFAELGYGLTRATSEPDLPGSSIETRTTSWGTRSAVGVIWYFAGN